MIDIELSIYIILFNPQKEPRGRYIFNSCLTDEKTEARELRKLAQHHIASRLLFFKKLKSADT